MLRIANIRALLPEGVLDNAFIDIDDGMICAIGQTEERSRDIDAHINGHVNGQGHLLMAGLIDLHGDMIERDVEPRPKAYFPTDLALFELDKRLAATGVTTAYAAISFAENNKKHYLRSEDKARATIELINAVRPQLLVDMRVHARFEITNHGAPAMLQELLEQAQLDLISINDHTPGQGQYRDLEAHIKHVAAWKGIEEASFRAEVLERLAQVENNPPSWEIVRAICAEAQQRNIVIASHDDDTVDKVALMLQMGASISEFPVSLEAAQAAKGHGMWTIMGAPNAYRGQSNTGNLSALEAIQAGLVDILAADYYPAAMLHSVFKLERLGILPLHEAAKLVSQNAAHAAQLHDRGSLCRGKRADMVLVDTREERARVRLTLRQGKMIFSDGSIDLTAFRQAQSEAKAPSLAHVSKVA